MGSEVIVISPAKSWCTHGMPCHPTFTHPSIFQSDFDITFCPPNAPPSLLSSQSKTLYPFSHFFFAYNIHQTSTKRPPNVLYLNSCSIVVPSLMLLIVGLYMCELAFRSRGIDLITLISIYNPTFRV